MAQQDDDPLTTQAQAWVGRVLREKWRLDQLLGVGGMAAVYAATHRNGARVAVKMLHAELSLEPTIRERFLREGYVGNSVEHGGVVIVLDDDVAEDGSVFLVMELLQGETLDARWQHVGGRMPAEDVLAIADQVLDVLAAAHTRGVIHRDIKPENVFLARGGVVKVLDFGIARLLERVGRSNATQAGSTLGTPAFMAPEQALGLVDQVDHRVDVWAVGATMFALLTGRLVHEGRTPNEQLVSAATKPARPLRIVVPDIHPVVAEVVDVALAFDKAQRWTDARSMQEAVREAYVALTRGGARAARASVDAEATVMAAPAPDVLFQPVPAGYRGSTGTVEADVALPQAARSNTTSGAAVGRTLPDRPRVKMSARVLVIAGVTGAAGFGILVVGGGLLSRSTGGAPVAASVTVHTPAASSFTFAAAPPHEIDDESQVIGLNAAPIADAGTPKARGSLSVIAVGGSCEAHLDGKSLGFTPTTAVSVPAGPQRVVCSRDGQADLVQLTEVPADGHATATFTLPESAATPTKPATVKPPPKTTPRSSPPPSRSRDPLDVRTY